MTKTMRYEELFWRLSTRTIVTLASAVMILILMAVNGDQKLKLLEETLGRQENFTYGERIPVEECVERYVDGLPVPEPLELEETEEEILAVEVEEVTAVTVVEVKSMNLLTSEAELILLAKLMHAEEGVLRRELPYEEAKRAHMLCGSVVLNRLNMNYLGDTTIAEVIYAPGQYACIENLNQEVPEETIQWARELIENGPIGPSNMIYQAEFEQGSSTYDHIGNQYFCCQ